ncbi:MAG: hypothetical protein JNK49_12560 [Planctomycetes bacterium]|nr:hypothetical protein [Planctomycetota bacterium]
MTRFAPAVVVLAVVAAAWAAVAGMPLLSESWTQLALVRGFAGPASAFDPALVPFRPLQHLGFWLFDRVGAEPAVGRAVTFGCHVGAALLVFAITVRLGASRRAAWCAMLLFLAWPSAKGLTWLAAVSGPARTCCLLWLSWAAVAWSQRPSAALGAGMVAVLAIALGFHQSCVIAPVVVGLGLVALASGTLLQRARAACAALRQPMLLGFVLLAAGYAFYVGVLQQRSYHGAAQGGAIAANVARAVLAFAPEWLRLPALDGLRSGGAGLVLGGAAVAGLAGAWAWAFWRGDATTRWLLAIVPLDLVLPVATTGFVGRYAYFGAALLAIALARSIDRVGGALRVWGVPVLVGALWAFDHAVDIRELQKAGQLLQRLGDGAAAARAAAGPGQRVALVDAPDHVGGDNDIPVANWGLAEALAARGIDGPWLLLRVPRCWTTSDHRAVDAAELSGLAADPALPVWRYDAAVGTFVRWTAR